MSIQDLVSKSLDQIRTEMFGQLSAKQEEYSAKGWLPIRLNLNKGIVRGMLELWNWGLSQVYIFLALILKQAFPESATDLWLDLHCRQVNVFRKQATKATGIVYFMRSGTAGNVPIPADRVLKTAPDGAGNVWRFITTAAAVLPDGATEVAVAVEAEEYGQGANVTPGQIANIVTTIPGVDAVENRAGWLTGEGADKELDDPLRLRYFLAWMGLSGCTKYAYQAWALAVTGVVSAKILDQHPRGQGTVDVVVMGTAGIPTEQLLGAVSANILGTGHDDEKIPINDDVQIKGPTAVPIDIVAELVITHGDPATILALAESRERALFGASVIAGIIPLGVGMDGTCDRLKWPMIIDGVKKINLTSPAADVAVADDALATLNSINLTYSIAEE